ncbi:MAG: response regulator [Acidobacteriota bacterium]
MQTTILIVEDEGLIALDLKGRLERLGYVVPAIADNAADALLNVERLQPSLVLMDIRLKGEPDGVATAEEIRRRFHVPVMFVTAHADPETLARARITEPYGYIVKPFHGVDFRAQIEIALWKHSMEQKLRDREALLSTTFRNVADALIATDREGNIAFMNIPAAELTGWPVAEASGTPLLDIFQAYEEITEVPLVHPIHAIYDGGEVSTQPRTYKLIKRGGVDWVLVEAEFSANRDEGSLLGVIVVFRDITERRKADEQARKSEKLNAMGMLAIGLGRELSQSQSRLDALLRPLLAQAKAEGKQAAEVEDIAQLLASQQSTVRQLISLGRADAGQPALLDLNELLNGMQGPLQKVLGFRPLSMRLQPEMPLVKADPQSLRENVLRLVADARQAMPDGGSVEISTQSIGLADGTQSARLSIRDSSKGIRAEAKEHIFDPYYQARPGNRNPGFSLALVQQFVAASGGAIEVESSAGAGTAYVLTFPGVDRSQDPASQDTRLIASARR